jgi:hypothetical protein
MYPFQWCPSSSLLISDPPALHQYSTPRVAPKIWRYGSSRAGCAACQIGDRFFVDYLNIERDPFKDTNNSLLLRPRKHTNTSLLLPTDHVDDQDHGGFAKSLWCGCVVCYITGIGIRIVNVSNGIGIRIVNVSKGSIIKVSIFYWTLNIRYQD